MKYIIFVIFTLSVAHAYPQSVFLEKIEKGNGKFWVITIDKNGEPLKNYWPSCYFGDATKLSDSIRLYLIEQLLLNINNDTSYSYKTVEALSYRNNGRYIKPPQTIRYNIQVAALVLINYIAFSSDAVEYSPFPVLIDKKSKKEFATRSKKLEDVIKDYMEWFRKVKIKGFCNYSLPLMNKKYEWYGSLYSKQRIFAKTSEWAKFYDCPILIKQED